MAPPDGEAMPRLQKLGSKMTTNRMPDSSHSASSQIVPAQRGFTLSSSVTAFYESASR